MISVVQIPSFRFDDNLSLSSILAQDITNLDIITYYNPMIQRFAPIQSKDVRHHVTTETDLNKAVIDMIKLCKHDIIALSTGNLISRSYRLSKQYNALKERSLFMVGGGVMCGEYSKLFDLHLKDIRWADQMYFGTQMFVRSAVAKFEGFFYGQTMFGIAKLLQEQGFPLGNVCDIVAEERGTLHG